MKNRLKNKLRICLRITYGLTIEMNRIAIGIGIRMLVNSFYVYSYGYSILKPYYIKVDSNSYKVQDY